MMTMMPTITKPKLLTADDLLRLHSKGVKGELIRGELCATMSVGLKHGEIAIALGAMLLAYVRPRRLGRVFGSDAGVLLERNPDTVREPDVAYISAERLPLDTDISGYCPVVPDLVVEIVSPSDGPAAADDKAAMWLRYGARAALVINPETLTVSIRRPNRPAAVLTIDDTLEVGDILPGFACPVRDIL